LCRAGRGASLASGGLRTKELLYSLCKGAPDHDCWVMMNGSAVTLISPRKGQSSATISTTTSPSVAASVAVIAMCILKSSYPKKYVYPVVIAAPKNIIHQTTSGTCP